MDLLIDGVCEAKNGRSARTHGCVKPKGHDGPEAKGFDKFHINGRAEMWWSDNHGTKSRAAQPVGTAKPESEKGPRLDVNHE